jgi:type I restriction enzyme S subunit
MSEEATLDDFADSGNSSSETQTNSTELRIGPFEYSLPPEWDTASLSEACENKDGERVPVKKSKRESMDGEIPYYGASGQIDTVDDFLFDERLLLLAEDGANLLTRNSPIAYIIEGKSWVNNHAHVLKPKKGHNIWYLAGFLELLDYEPFVTGTAQPKLTQNSMGFLKVPKPPLSEQRKIATVLYTVDRAIEKNEKIRENARDVEEASKTEFFTSGYTEWELDESVGWRCRANQFPKGWKVKPAEELMEITRGASPRPRSDDSLFGGEIPWIKIGDADREISKRIEQVDSYVTEKGKQKSKFVEEGTLLVANSGATCGFSVFAGVDGCVHDGWLILRGYDEFIPNFLYYYINWNYDYLQSLSLGSAQTNLSTGLFGRLDIPIPPIQEQQQIVEALDSINRVASHASLEVDRLTRLKRGLMQDLLSGMVRTTDTNIEVPEEIAKYG